MWPLVRTASGVHEDSSAAKAGAGGGHGGVPEMTADVVDDLSPGFNGRCGRCVEGVDGEDGAGLRFEDGFDDGKDAVLLFAGGEGYGAGTGGFAADVEDVGSFVEHMEGLGYGAVGGILWGVEVASVGEGVGGDVEDTHDDGPLAKRHGAGAEEPLEGSAAGEGHSSNSRCSRE